MVTFWVIRSDRVQNQPSREASSQRYSDSKYEPKIVPDINNLVAVIISQIVTYDFPNVWDGFLDKVCDGLAEDDISQIDCSLRILIRSIKHEEKYHVLVSKVLDK